MRKVIMTMAATHPPTIKKIPNKEEYPSALEVESTTYFFTPY
jgi:hypothetical protein